MLNATMEDLPLERSDICVAIKIQRGGARDFSCRHGNVVDLDIVQLHDKSAPSAC